MVSSTTSRDMKIHFVNLCSSYLTYFYVTEYTYHDVELGLDFIVTSMKHRDQMH